MTQTNKLQTQPKQPVTLAKPILIGAGIGLMLISFFLVGVRTPDPAWGKLWMIQPLMMVSFAGAMGGVFYYFMDYLSCRNGLNRTVAVILSLIVFIIGLWLGFVLGLNGTMWH